MKLLLASGLGVTLGLMTATGRAQEANWRAAKSQATQPPAPVTLALTPIAAVAIPEPRPAPPAPAPAPRAESTVSARAMAHWLSDQPRPVTVISQGGSEPMTASVRTVIGSEP